MKDMIMDLGMDSSVLNPQSNPGIMDEHFKNSNNPAAVAVVSPAASSSDDSSSVVSSDEDSDVSEEVSSGSSASSSTGQLAPPNSAGPLQDMSSLLQELPFKRGLSKHYNGKSQSFTSLANVRSLEDLAKPENPYNKKLKSCKSYGGFSLESSSHGSSSPPSINSSTAAAAPPPPPTGRGGSSHSPSSGRMTSSKKGSRGGSCSSLGVKRNSSFLGNNANRPPPIPTPRRSTSSTGFTSQTPLFALGV